MGDNEDTPEATSLQPEDVVGPANDQDVRSETNAAEAPGAEIVGVLTQATIATAGVSLSQQPLGFYVTAEQEAAVAGDLVVPPHEPEPIVVEEGAIWEPASTDVLSGRGASVNAHPGNKKFRALCFSRKAMFDAANHAAKRRISTEIWTACVENYGSRFLKKRQDKGPWYEQGAEQAQLKAAQVMRDYRRPDRLVQRELLAAAGKKRNRATATPMDDVPIPPPPEEPIVENPEGVHEHDVLCGRGAFVNGHTGNHRLRQLAVARKPQFDAGSYTEKRALAIEIVAIIKDLKPPGRFLRKAKPTKAVEGQVAPPSAESDWEELDVERCIHKACQVMRDIDREDRKDRDERRRLKKLRTEDKVPDAGECLDVNKEAEGQAVSDSAVMSAAGKADEDDSEVVAVEEAIAAIEGATSPEMPVKTETV